MQHGNGLFDLPHPFTLVGVRECMYTLNNLIVTIIESSCSTGDKPKVFWNITPHLPFIVASPISSFSHPVDEEGSWLNMSPVHSLNKYCLIPCVPSVLYDFLLITVVAFLQILCYSWAFDYFCMTTPNKSQCFRWKFIKYLRKCSLGYVWFPS